MGDEIKKTAGGKPTDQGFYGKDDGVGYSRPMAAFTDKAVQQAPFSAPPSPYSASPSRIREAEGAPFESRGIHAQPDMHPGVE